MPAITHPFFNTYFPQATHNAGYCREVMSRVRCCLLRTCQQVRNRLLRNYQMHIVQRCHIAYVLASVPVHHYHIDDLFTILCSSLMPRVNVTQPIHFSCGTDECAAQHLIERCLPFCCPKLGIVGRWAACIAHPFPELRTGLPSLISYLLAPCPGPELLPSTI